MKTKPQDVRYCGVNPDKIGSAQPKINEQALELYCRWIKERYTVHLKKDVEKLPPPWTSWDIMQKYRFCNVRREQDRESRYLIEHIVENAELTLEEKILNILVFRFWNKSQTFEIMGFPKKKALLLEDDFDIAEEVALKFQKENPSYVWYTAVFCSGGIKRVWANEEQLWAKGDPKDLCMPRRPFYMWNWCIKNDIVGKILESKNQFDCYDSIRYNSSIPKGIPGFGEFLAYQVFVDMSYIPEFSFSENEFTIAGPGCKMGLRYLFEDSDGMTPEEQLFWLRDHQNALLKKYDVDLQELMTDLPPIERSLSVMSLENIMCEGSKTFRAVYKNGKPKMSYKYRNSDELF